MNGGSSFSQVAIEKLVGDNYSYWKLCMEAYLQGQDLWQLIFGVETVIPEDTPQNVEPQRKWRIKSGKALFALRTSISKYYIQHVRDINSPKQVWEALERLFTQKNTMRARFKGAYQRCTLVSLSYSWFEARKSETFSKSIQFKQRVEQELGQAIKCLRTDNGGEYMSNEFLIYCEKEGIQRQLTYPNTSQQNGVAERKLAHPIIVFLSWFHEKRLPRELRAEAMQCAYHAINRLHVMSRAGSRTKLDPKARKCVFVGYDSRWKGCQCMDPDTTQFITSHDLVFYEVSSYYAAENLGSDDVSLEPFSTGCMSSNMGSSSLLFAPPLQQDRAGIRRSTRERKQPRYL